MCDIFRKYGGWGSSRKLKKNSGNLRTENTLTRFKNSRDKFNRKQIQEDIHITYSREIKNKM